MSTSTISNTPPPAKHDPDIETITKFLTTTHPQGEPILTLSHISLTCYKSVFKYLRSNPQDTLDSSSSSAPIFLKDVQWKYRIEEHTLFVKHPDMPNGIRRVFPNFVASNLHSTLLASGVFSESELNNVEAKSGEPVPLERHWSKEPDLAIWHKKEKRNSISPKIVFEVCMGQRYEDVLADVKEWLVCTRGGVKLAVLVYYEEGKVPDEGRKGGESADEPKTQDRYIPLHNNLPPLTYYFETYRYDITNGGIKPAQGRTYLFENGKKVTPEPTLTLGRWDFGLRGSVIKDGEDSSKGRVDKEGGDDTVGTGNHDNTSKYLYRMPLGRLQNYIEREMVLKEWPQGGETRWVKGKESREVKEPKKDRLVKERKYTS